ncbi:helix-turn-helix domain-containing protein [Isoptericola sp. NPDC019482]|uniref:helix-turn-helix domain-containing protein n=1 Tax=Isoptericola sp. NPDC019482 TaxID=3154688 RepID=UPI00348BF945
MAGIALTTPAQIGAAIRSARIREGLTQTGLAERAGVSRRWLIALEQGQAQRAELGKILDTLDALGLDLTVTRATAPDKGLADLLEDL